MRLARVLVIAAIALAALLQPRPAAAAAMDSAYRFESAFLTGLKPGDTGQFSVFFDNVGTTAWATNTFTQVNLGVCLSDKVTCNVDSPLSAWNPGTWTSTKAYATQAKAIVGPGDFTAFTFAIKVPAGVAVGTYRFNGDLVIANTGAKLHPEGYYQDATVTSTGPLTTAPTIQIQVADLDGGGRQDDVRTFFTTPTGNPLTTYDVQRAVGDCPVPNTSASFTTIQTLFLVGGSFGAFNDLDRSGGTYCYQVRVKTEIGTFVYSNQAHAVVFGPAPSTDTPISTSIVITSNGGTPGFLDGGKVFVISYNVAMSFAAGATIRVVDADCGAPASPSSGPASCTPPATQTVADIVCGTNASCAPGLDAKSLTVSMTGQPNQVIAGSQPGVSLPADITQSTGITSQTGINWSIATSTARVIGP